MGYRYQPVSLYANKLVLRIIIINLLIHIIIGSQNYRPSKLH